MPYFRKKPVVVYAVQYFPGVEIGGSLEPKSHKAVECRRCGEPIGSHIIIPTLEGQHIACPGDWIITGVQGEKYPCKPDIFEETYECVECHNVDEFYNEEGNDES